MQVNCFSRFCIFTRTLCRMCVKGVNDGKMRPLSPQQLIPLSGSIWSKSKSSAKTLFGNSLCFQISDLTWRREVLRNLSWVKGNRLGISACSSRKNTLDFGIEKLFRSKLKKVCDPASLGKSLLLNKRAQFLILSWIEVVMSCLDGTWRSCNLESYNFRDAL